MRPRVMRTTAPSGWPKWNRQCEQIVWSTAKRCTKPCSIGSDYCTRHGGRARVSQIVAWRRYLLWVLLPESVRSGMWSPVTDEEVQTVANLIAIHALEGTTKCSATVKMKAAEYLLEVATLMEDHEDPASLMTHLSRADAEKACDILRYNGLIRSNYYELPPRPFWGKKGGSQATSEEEASTTEPSA